MAAKSLGGGRASAGDFGSFGLGTIVESAALVFHPARVYLGDDVYVSHFAYVHGHPESEISIGDRTFIGPYCYLHGAADIRIGTGVGIGAGVITLTSVHADSPPHKAITEAPLRYGPIEIGDGCDIGIGALLLPGTKLGPGVQVGAGAVVRGEHPGGAIIAGIPARMIRMRGEGDWAEGLSDTPAAISLE
jgi:acetyltransferase-like isoleucine patch superfamily enzyme